MANTQEQGAERKAWLDTLQPGAEVHARDQGYDTPGSVAKVQRRDDKLIHVEIPPAGKKKKPEEMAFCAVTGWWVIRGQPPVHGIRIDELTEERRIQIRKFRLVNKLVSRGKAAWNALSIEQLEAAAKAAGVDS